MSSHRTYIPENLKTSGGLLFNGKTCATADYKGIAPVGSDVIYLVAMVTMGNAASLTLSVVTADDADGTTPVALIQNIPIFVNDVKQTQAKSYAVTADTGNFIVVFCVPSLLIPTSKYICLTYADSDVGNVLSAQAFTDGFING